MMLDAPLQIRALDVQGQEDALAARLYTAGACAAKSDTLLVFFHGGGFVGGDLDQADPLLRQLASEGVSVLASTYTLAGVRPFPAAVEDAHAVLAWARKHKTALKWSGKRLVVAGIEAGANLAAACTLMARDRGGPALAGQVLIMPMLDPGMSSGSMRAMRCPNTVKLADSCAASYRGYLPHAADRMHPYAAPLHASRLKQLPPALILAAEADPLCDEAEQYARKLDACAVPVTVRRIDPVPLQDPQARMACACRHAALDEIQHFLAALA
ncbi:alpha/beta hydrolase [Massilia sp. TS11]|uniref:alpha/beta hydrolase n=1 Tax=Massilia sp. TS11 TaxID=2908003 RepID=UPI001EDA665F|nr:alpha/beta hydrolase [Massilia sp. TS11]MCG2584470.1 alpha/beta hydrolase [Massilia sp. TS11]